MASDELAAKLNRRIQKCEGDAQSGDADLMIPKEVHASPSGDATSELGSKLSSRRDAVDNPAEDAEARQASRKDFKVFNPYTEFPEFSRKSIQNLQTAFKTYDYDKDNFIDFNDLKRMMEKLGCPQTHLGLKQMITELDEDKDNKISFREDEDERRSTADLVYPKSEEFLRENVSSRKELIFLMLFRRARAGEFSEMTGLQSLYEKYEHLQEIAVEEVGVKEAKNFFQSKIEAQQREKSFEEEIRQEQEQKARLAEEQKKRKEEFKNKKALFQ